MKKTLRRDLKLLKKQIAFNKLFETSMDMANRACEKKMFEIFMRQRSKNDQVKSLKMEFRSIESAPKNKTILLGYKNGDIEIGCCRLGELTQERQFFVSKGISTRQPIAWCDYPLFDPKQFCQNTSSINEWIEFAGTQDQIEDIKHAKNGIKTKNNKGEISEIIHYPRSTFNYLLKIELRHYGITHYMIVE